MTKGLEIRAQIDTEVVKGLLLLNGGGAVALLALLPTVIGKPGFSEVPPETSPSTFINGQRFCVSAPAKVRF